jgi:hypothetical protein
MGLSRYLTEPVETEPTARTMHGPTERCPLPEPVGRRPPQAPQKSHKSTSWTAPTGSPRTKRHSATHPGTPAKIVLKSSSDQGKPGLGAGTSALVDGGQGQGRTADLPLFRRTLVPTELPDLDGGPCGPTSAVLTGFEPATSTLTGWRALRAALQDHSLSPTLADDVPQRGLAHNATACARMSISPERSWLSLASRHPGDRAA